MMNPNEEATTDVASSSATCRRAMALNNLGVSMMAMEQGGALHNAISIFKDSFAVMSSKHNIPSGGEFGDVFLAVSQEMQEPASSSATIRYQMMAQQLANDNVSLHPMEICPCDDGDISFQISVLPYIAKFVPIHLRSRDFYDQQDEHANLVMAIIMYNHGLAHLLAHLQDKKRYTSGMMMGCNAGSSTQLGRKLLRGAVVALNCSQVMIDRHLDAIDKHDEKKGGGLGRQTTFEKLGALVVSAMTLKAMMWTSRLDNQDQEAAVKVGAKLSHVLVDMDRYQDQLRQLNVDMCQNPTTSTAA